jgi:hypothetical protein
MGTHASFTARYKRTVDRVTRETSWLFTEQTALIALGPVRAHGLDFFRVAFTGLLGDRLIRLVRVLEDDTRVASFWYLHRCNPKDVEQALLGAGMSLADLRDFSRRLRAIRNKAFVHIDKAGVFDPRKIYKEAGIKNSDVDKTIRALWTAMQDLYHTTFGQAYRRSTYSGADITLLEECRNEISPRA